MKTRRITALVLTVVMVLTMSTAVFAADQNSDPQETTVTYTKAQTYTWSVPSSLTAGGTGSSGNVTASDVYIGYGKTLTISITSGVTTDGDSKTITLTDKTDNRNTITASVSYDNLTVAAGTTTGGSKTITIGTPSCDIAGEYTGSITFTAAVA